MKKKIIILFTAMVIIIIAVFTIASLVDRNGNDLSVENHENIRVVTSFYPVYVLTKNLTDEITDIKVDSLTDFSAGCLHDYQLTTNDMRLLSNADVFIINGGGMEDYLSDVIESYPNLMVINISEDIPMLESMEHEGEGNPHVWLDPELYIAQIMNAYKGLEQYVMSIAIEDNVVKSTSDESNSSHDISKNMNISANDSVDIIARLDDNTKEYIDEIEEIVDDMNLILDSVKDRVSNNDISNKVVVFHDAFAYLANKAGLEVIHTVEVDEDHPLSAGEIAEVIDVIKEENIRYLFTEEQHDGTISDRIKEETGALVYIIDSAVTGDGSNDSYIDAMRSNIETLKKAFK